MTHALESVCHYCSFLSLLVPTANCAWSARLDVPDCGNIEAALFTYSIVADCASCGARAPPTAKANRYVHVQL